jgi:hypothetical protein
MRQQLVAPALIFCVSACVRTPEDIVPRPTDLTIQSAILQIQEGIVSAVERANRTGQYAGFYPCTAQAVLNVTADAHNQNTLVLDASVKPPSPAAPSLSLSNTYGVSSNASVGNQITVVLASSLCLPAPSSSQAPSSSKATGAKPAVPATGAAVKPPQLPPPPEFAPPPPR